MEKLLDLEIKIKEASTTKDVIQSCLDSCGKRMFSYSDYLRKCFEPTIFNCAWCDIEFVASAAIELHVRQVHPFNCYNCIKSLATWDDLLSHAEVCKESRSNIGFFVSSCVGGSLTGAPFAKK